MRHRYAPAVLALATCALAIAALKHGPAILSAVVGAREGWSPRIIAQVAATMTLPLLAYASSPALRRAGGLRTADVGDGLRVVIRVMAFVGPACVGFALVGMLGWGFGEWRGALLLSLIFAVAAFFVVRLPAKPPTGRPRGAGGVRGTYAVVAALVAAGLVAGAVLGFGDSLPAFPRRLLYFPLVVAVGEELLFRGAVQSGLNAAFGRPYTVGGVSYGVGLPAAALLFGLAHAVAPTPEVWPWMTFTAVGGLILGYVRERGGSLLAPMAVHALMDAPLIFMG